MRMIESTLESVMVESRLVESSYFISRLERQYKMFKPHFT